MSQSLQLPLDSTLEDLPSHDYRVSPTIWGEIVAKKLYQNPDLPGVLVVDDSQLLGMISRAQFGEHMNWPNRAQIYNHKPIQKLLDAIRIPPLVLSKQTPVREAAELATNRPRNLTYEPIIISGGDQEFRLLDFRVLCQAQNQLLRASQSAIMKMSKSRRKQLEFIGKEKRRLDDLSKQLKLEQNIAKKLYRDRYRQKESAVGRHYQDLLQLYQELVRECQLVSGETHRACHSIFLGAHSISEYSEQLEAVIRGITRDWEIITSASAVIGEIVQKVRYLSVQASVLNYQSGETNPTVLGQINFEMNRLVKQTLDVSQQIAKVASQFKLHLQTLQEMGRQQTQVARKITLDSQRGETAIAELDRLLERQDATLVELLKKQSTSDEAAVKDLLNQDMTGIDTRFQTPERRRPNSGSEHLIELIEKSLKNLPHKN
ncbi:chemotaxis protein [Lyngbya sp. CCY1209]|uniref:chemotaxis protein n=1 Tax=Lyngbya sp. CCY1209 TaxID=2886103 RepID=UPI002D209997|nr:chemotaxis protein [Lyngbya sp. CCY1209]MEB3886776.1 chemotaxis protein [Lyngbya sp. CCY1209]